MRFFDRLAGDGLLFTNFYANGTRTNKGLSALLFSYPDFLPNEALMRSFTFRNKRFSSLAVLLKIMNYQTYFATGGAIGFDNMEGMLQKNGFDRLVGLSDFDLSSKRADRWTVPDEVTFDEAHRQFSEFARNGKPFFGVILTLSNHLLRDGYYIQTDLAGGESLVFPGPPGHRRGGTMEASPEWIVSDSRLLVQATYLLLGK